MIKINHHVITENILLIKNIITENSYSTVYRGIKVIEPI